MIKIGRYINGITLNPLEYLLDKNGDVRRFRTKKTEKIFLRRKGMTEEEIYWLTFEKV